MNLQRLLTRAQRKALVAIFHRIFAEKNRTFHNYVRHYVHIRDYVSHGPPLICVIQDVRLPAHCQGRRLRSHEILYLGLAMNALSQPQGKERIAQELWRAFSPHFLELIKSIYRIGPE